MRFIVCGIGDLASDNIYSCLRNLYEWKPIGDGPFGTGLYVLTNDSTIWLSRSLPLVDESLFTVTNWASKMDVQIGVVIMAAWHEGIVPKSVLVHAGGSLTPSSRGNFIARSNCDVIRSLVNSVQNHVESSELEGVKVFLEATHGPPIPDDIPFAAIEIGGPKLFWKNKAIGEAIAKTLVVFESPAKVVYSILLGGGHCSEFGAEVQTKSEFAIGHFIPSYAINENNLAGLVQLIVERTFPEPTMLICDLSRKKFELVSGLLEKSRLKLVNRKDLKKHEFVPRSV